MRAELTPIVKVQIESIRAEIMTHFDSFSERLGEAVEREIQLALLRLDDECKSHVETALYHKLSALAHEIVEKEIKNHGIHERLCHVAIEAIKEKIKLEGI